ncbi:MAG: GNAT family N-acetyltransferase [Chloroflexi bacterium]|nr:MAG: GNAT family N-acetyltransferase [Chloroflexota bacterium]
MRLAALQEAPYAFGSVYEREVDAPEERWRKALRDRTRFIAEIDGVVAGTVSGGEGDSEGVAAMTAMWVDPRYRRQSVGDLLVKTVVEWARAAGYADMLLWVADGNVNAERLYVRNGFARTGADQEMRPGQLEYEMSRRL